MPKICPMGYRYRSLAVVAVDNATPSAWAPRPVTPARSREPPALAA